MHCADCDEPFCAVCIAVTEGRGAARVAHGESRSLQLDQPIDGVKTSHIEFIWTSPSPVESDRFDPRKFQTSSLTRFVQQFALVGPFLDMSIKTDIYYVYYRIGFVSGKINVPINYDDWKVYSLSKLDAETTRSDLNKRGIAYVDDYIRNKTTASASAAIENPLQTKKSLIFDFDKTLTLKHTGGCARDADISTPLLFFRKYASDPDFLVELFAQNSWNIAIASYSDENDGQGNACTYFGSDMIRKFVAGMIVAAEARGKYIDPRYIMYESFRYVTYAMLREYLQPALLQKAVDWVKKTQSPTVSEEFFARGSSINMVDNRSGSTLQSLIGKQLHIEKISRDGMRAELGRRGNGRSWAVDNILLFDDDTTNVAVARENGGRAILVPPTATRVGITRQWWENNATIGF